MMLRHKAKAIEDELLEEFNRLSGQMGLLVDLTEEDKGTFSFLYQKAKRKFASTSNPNENFRNTYGLICVHSGHDEEALEQFEILWDQDRALDHLTNYLNILSLHNGRDKCIEVLQSIEGSLTFDQNNLVTLSYLVTDGYDPKVFFNCFDKGTINFQNLKLIADFIKSGEIYKLYLPKESPIVREKIFRLVDKLLNSPSFEDDLYTTWYFVTYLVAFATQTSSLSEQETIAYLETICFKEEFKKLCGVKTLIGSDNLKNSLLELYG